MSVKYGYFSYKTDTNPSSSMLNSPLISQTEGLMVNLKKNLDTIYEEVDFTAYNIRDIKEESLKHHKKFSENNENIFDIYYFYYIWM